MKEIIAQSIIKPLADMIENSLIEVELEACALINNAAKIESSALCKWALNQIALNNEIAKKNRWFACQDCGQAVLFVNIGQDVHISGDLNDALNKGVEQGYKLARKSVACSIDRLNTLTNTPAIIHYNINLGDELEIIFLSKGAGSENMSNVHMLTPSKGTAGIIDSVLKTVKAAGANPCPPIIIGVGIGGTMEKCAILSKLALCRKSGEPSKDEKCRLLEEQILNKVNALGIGAQGFGGDITALSVAVESFPTHIGMLPVAVNIQCHSVRHARLTM